VHPDGASELISYGVLNLSHGMSHEAPSRLVPGEDFEVQVTLDQAGYRVPAGHCLRVALSTALWPMIWPSPERARLTVKSARIDLPARPLGEGDETRFPPPEGAEPWRTETLRPARSMRRVEEDQVTGMVRLRIDDDFGAVRDLDHGLESGSAVGETWTIHPDDPLSARVECRWTQTLARGDWSVRTEAAARLHADAGNFHLSARLEAFEGDAPVFSRDFSGSIPRDHV
jgi:hypothetical protein